MPTNNVDLATLSELDLLKAELKSYEDEVAEHSEYFSLDKDIHSCKELIDKYEAEWKVIYKDYRTASDQATRAEKAILLQQFLLQDKDYQQRIDTEKQNLKDYQIKQMLDKPQDIDHLIQQMSLIQKKIIGKARLKA